ncbi:MAG TPA: patatin-like phospholipase family protein [Bryobacteraceae bacterium]|nr:patatin-like phospholipase family protein [Bryobacteraceae bacterium]
MRRAIVFSGGGVFGAWQAGAWRALEARLPGRPDVIVGASVGSLNGYAIAGGASAAELCEFWMQPQVGRFRRLPDTIRTLMERYPLRMEYALTLTDLAAMKPRMVHGPDVTWKHLAASCAIPGLIPQRRIGGRWYSDGGLLNPLPVWAAVAMGATEIIAVHALPEIPSVVLKPFVRGFRKAFGYHPPLPKDVELVTIQPEGALGSVRDALAWKQENVERWIALGEEAAKNISIPNCFWR